MTLFLEAVERVLESEGLYSEDPADPGGATKFGISLYFAGSIQLDINGDGKTTKADIQALSREQAISLYLEHFWDKMSCGLLPPPLACIVFDGAVNQGRMAMARLLQRAVGTPDDGIIGSATIMAAKVACMGRKSAILTVSDLCAKRARRYSKTKNFGRFGGGWLARLARENTEAGLLIARSVSE